MFLASLLHRSRRAKQVIEAMDQAGAWRYFPEVAGTTNSLIARGLKIKSNLNKSTLRRLFKESFLLFRSRISSRNVACHDFFIEQKPVRKIESYGDAALWRYGSKLIRHFNENEDLMVDRIHQLSFFDWIPSASTQAPLLKHGEVYCPLDGPVIPLNASERTSAFSWEILCGIEWTLYLCPKCLGVFESRVFKRN
jgi:hypothetical protein